MEEKKTISMEQLLNKMEDNACRRHMRVHDSEGNKEYWKGICKALDRRMDDLDGWCSEEDRKSYVEGLEEHKEN